MTLHDDVTAGPVHLSRELIELAVRCARDPLGFVRVGFPWGRDALSGHTGPDEWQAEVLTAIGTGLATPEQAVRLAISTGHGTGKSCLVSWIILWGLVTCADCRGVITANTEVQLKQKTFAELSKWYRLCLWNSWFTLTATALHATDPKHEKTWRIDAVAWSEKSIEAFAGLHNQGARVLVIFDEASAIPDVIWETTEGALTDSDTEILWLVAGNPTRNTGRFRECFGRFKHRWISRQVDSRSVKITNKQQIDAWVNDYGLSSDFVKVRVLGEFPSAGSMQFIGSDLVAAAVAREAESLPTDPLVLGVDVARFGSDQSVIFFRKGRDARTILPLKFRGIDTMALAARVADEAHRHRADAIFVDGGGVGGGVIDRLRQMRIPGVVEIQFGGASDRANYETDQTRTKNKRAEMWSMMKVWLARGAIPNDPELIADLTNVEYGYDADNAIVLEKKEDMKKRGLASTDCGDALCLTFAAPVMPRAFSGSAPAVRPERRVFDPHSAFVQEKLPWV